jgi:hypothetical protein
MNPIASEQAGGKKVGRRQIPHNYSRGGRTTFFLFPFPSPFSLFVTCIVAILVVRGASRGSCRQMSIETGPSPFPLVRNTLQCSLAICAKTANKKLHLLEPSLNSFSFPPNFRTYEDPPPASRTTIFVDTTNLNLCASDRPRWRSNPTTPTASTFFLPTYLYTPPPIYHRSLPTYAFGSYPLWPIS